MKVLRELRHYDAACLLWQECCDRFPQHPGLTSVFAGVLEDECLFPDMVKLLRDLHDNSAAVPRQVNILFSRALALAGDEIAAEDTCASAIVGYPEDKWLAEWHVSLAARRGDFNLAVERATEWKRRYPDSHAMDGIYKRFSILSHDTTCFADRDPPASENMFTRFESLGATSGGCEFGFVQRLHGAEPIGLLRWGNMKIDGLTKALSNEFEGLGTAQNTRLFVQPVSGNKSEYFLCDDRYSFRYHTFIRTDEAPEDKVYLQALKRLVFLRRKLIEDLRLAEKIFVFKVTGSEYECDLDSLFDAIRLYGNCKLLCVTLADDTHLPGSIDVLRDGFYNGRVAMFADAGPGIARGIDQRSWAQICGQVHAWHAGQKILPASRLLLQS